MQQQPNVRICRLKRWNNYPGFGVHLLRTADDHGIQIGDVEPSSPAASCGLISGDKIIEINRRNVENEQFINILQLLQGELAKDTIEFMVVDRDNANSRIDRTFPNIQQKETPSSSDQGFMGTQPDDAVVMASLVGRGEGETWDKVMKNVMDHLPTIKPQNADERVVTPSQLDEEFKNALETKMAGGSDADEWYRGDEELERVMDSAQNRTYRARTVTLEKRGDFNGFGLTISSDSDVGHVITEVAPNSPAARAEVKRGDCVLQIGEDVVLQLPYKELAQRLQRSPARINISIAPKDVILKCAIEHVPILTQYDRGAPKGVRDSQYYSSAENFQPRPVFRPQQPEVRPISDATVFPQRPASRPPPLQQPEIGDATVFPARPAYRPPPQQPEIRPTSDSTVFQPRPNIDNAPRYSTRDSIPINKQPEIRPTSDATVFQPRPNIDTAPRYSTRDSVPTNKPAMPPSSAYVPTAMIQQPKTQPTAPYPPGFVPMPENRTSISAPGGMAPPVSRPVSVSTSGYEKPAQDIVQHQVGDVQKRPSLIEQPITRPVRESEIQRQNRQTDSWYEPLSRPVSQMETDVRQSIPPQRQPSIGVTAELATSQLGAGSTRKVFVRKGDKPTLGFELKTLFVEEKQERIHAFGNVQKNLPAYDAGVRDGDVLEAVNGISVDGLEHQEVLRILRENVKNLNLELRRDPYVENIFRQQAEQSRQAQVEEEHKAKRSSVLPDKDVLQTRINVSPTSESLGLRVTPELVIHHVTPGSPADNAGLRVNDLIVQLDNQPVYPANYTDAFAMLKNGFMKKGIDVAVRRPSGQSRLSAEPELPIPIIREPTFAHSEPSNMKSIASEDSYHEPNLNESGEILPGSRRCTIANLVKSKPIGLTLKENHNKPHEISKIVQGSPAEAAGLQVHDLVLQVNGENVASATFSDVRSKIASSIPTGQVELEVISEELYPEQDEMERPDTSGIVEDYHSEKSETESHQDPPTSRRTSISEVTESERNEKAGQKSNKFAQLTRKLSMAAKGKGYKRCIMPSVSSSSSLGFTLFGSSSLEGIFYTLNIKPDQQAAMSGVEEGDLLVDVNGHPVKSLKFSEVIDLLKKETKDDSLTLGLINNKDLSDDNKLSAEIASGSMKKKHVKRTSFKTLASRFDLSKDV
ncbi:hypothetical protein ACOME3_003441 [Neoechinorhynchus agilis]